MRTHFPHFAELWQRLSATGDSCLVHSELIARYSEPHRAYHSVQHLEECLQHFDLAKEAGAMRNPDAVEMALWFHDVIYDPQGTDNEEESAATAERLLSEAEVSEPLISEIEQLVLATKNHVGEGGTDSSWIIDIDLAILGQPPARFQEYEAQIRKEYSWVPLPVYLEKRAEVLQRFLDRERLYINALFHERFERQARTNLHDATARLRTP